MKSLLFVITALLIATPWASAQRGQGGSLVFRDSVDPRWFAGNDKFWYKVTTARDQHEFVLVDAKEGKRSLAFDHERLAKALNEKTGKSFSASKLPITALKFSEDGKSVRLSGLDSLWSVHLETYELTEAKEESSSETSSSSGSSREGRRGRRSAPNAQSPDGKIEVLVRGHNLFLRDVKAEKEERLTHDGNPTSTYQRSSQRDRMVGMQYEERDPETPVAEVYWSPDSRWLVAMRTKPGTDRMVYMVASSPKDQLQPKLESYPYAKPGDDIPISKPRLFDTKTRSEILIDDALFENPWSISELRWHSNSTHFTFLYNQRGHQALRVIEVKPPAEETSEDEKAQPAKVRAVINEQSDTFVCYSGKYYCDYIDDQGEIVWMSERDGWNHLYLYDTATGRVKFQITQGEWAVRGVERVDRAKRQIWFQAGGVRPGQDPYHVHYCRVNFDGTGFVVLTEGDGSHTAQFSPDNRYFIDHWSRVDLPPQIELRSAEDGKLVCKLEEADARVLFATGWKPPERFVAKGRDGITDIYGIIHRPKQFQADGKYPVIEQIYAGPHAAHVPKTFRASYRWERLAEKGFVIVQIDGMGTSYRSKKFHDVCWKNIGDAGFPDRIRWIRAAAEQYPALDATRVGIYGGSAGGQNALGALLTHGDFYKAAAADCGCHDNRMDKIWWNEQWMGWPVGPHYEEQSNVTQAHKLKGKLLLTVGELDRNVDPASTMQVADALIKADKDFELIVFPNGGHGAGGSPYGERRRNEFFVRSLLEELKAPSAEGTASVDSDSKASVRN